MDERGRQEAAAAGAAPNYAAARDVDVVEDGPEMRSVMIQPGTLSGGSGLAGIGLRQAWDGAGAVAKKQPALEPGVYYGQNKASVAPQQLDVEVAESKNCVGWVINEHNLRPFPADGGVLERQNIEVNLPAQEVLSRVAGFMRAKSVACDFLDEENKVKGRTPNMLHFALHLWRGGEGGKKEVVVELQRIAGCAVEMQCLRRCLFRAIQTGKDPSAGSTSLAQVAYARGKPICNIVKGMYEKEKRAAGGGSSGGDGEVQIVNSSSPAKAGMDKCCELLASCCPEDKKRLGMESLLQMTDDTLVDEPSAREISRTLLFGAGPPGRTLREDLRKFLLPPSPPSEEETPDIANNDDANRTLALGILHNALQVQVQAASAAGSKEDVEDTSHFWRALAESLEYNRPDATKRPHEAALSAACIEMLQKMAVA